MLKYLYSDPSIQKSATEFKLKQKLLKYKRTIQIATFNVWTLNRIRPKTGANRFGDRSKYRQNVRTSTQMPNTEEIKYHDTGNRWTFVSASAWKNYVNATIGGVGMLIRQRAQKSLNCLENIQPRMMVATFNGNPSTTVISCYRPTNVSEETNLTTFYKELSSLTRNIQKHNVLIIGGIINAQFGKNVTHKFTLQTSLNRQG